MASDYPPEEKVLSIAREALREFLARDRDLLHVDAAEESISHRLAIYIEKHLPVGMWHVDCEYNRDKSKSKRGGVGELIIPDIMVHRRNTSKNALLIEVKKSHHSPADVEAARARCILVTESTRTDVPQYCHAVVMTFPIKSDAPLQIACDWYHRVGCGQLSGLAPRTHSDFYPPAGEAADAK